MFKLDKESRAWKHANSSEESMESDEDGGRNSEKMRKVMEDIKKNKFRRDILKDNNCTKEFYILAKKYLRDERIEQMNRKIQLMQNL